ncbi:uncharacterized protein LOC110768515 [Prunus avium]|uniref:Uncharacterized protein LOC110768515 n=1 Tax=Prunus avium TaxID=42229 RepID=A0A6P5TLE9_PRUAV|nr:uncharacterized protein LOC110768515 [Prunus avium]
MVKANCDGAWFEQTMRGGFGWVIRDFTGWMMQASGQGDMLYGSALMAEMDAIRAVLFACQQGGFSRVVVESDSQVAIKMVKGERAVAVEVDSILFNIQTAIREFQEVIFIFAPCNCNKIAHEDATFACRVGGSYYRDFVPPDWLFNTLAGDANVCVRL